MSLYPKKIISFEYVWSEQACKAIWIFMKVEVTLKVWFVHTFHLLISSMYKLFFELEKPISNPSENLGVLQDEWVKVIRNHYCLVSSFFFTNHSCLFSNL